MSAPAAVIARLEEVAAVTALVSTRIYQGILPQTPDLPAIRVQRISDDETVHLRGAGGAFVDRVQVDSVATSVRVAQAIDHAVHGDGAGTALMGWRGTAAGVQVTGVLPAGVRETYDADDLRQYKVMRDFFVHWKP